MDENIEKLPPEVEARLVEALDGLIDGSLSAEGITQLERDLKEYRAARELWNMICLQRSMLLDYFREGNTVTGQDYADLALKISEMNIELTSSIAPEPPVPPTMPMPLPAQGFFRSAAQFVSNNTFAVSLSFMIFVGLVTGAVLAINSLSRYDAVAPSIPTVEFVARITDMKECRFAAASPSAAKNEQLAVGGKLDIEKGLIEITYFNGAVVLVEGPASLAIDSSKSCRLERGRLAVRAETERSHGFAVTAGGSRFVDLGTQFGVKANSNKNTEIHVFQGAVEYRPTTREKTPEASVRLTQGKAARIGADSKFAYLPQADKNEFVMRMDVPRKKQLDLLDVITGGSGFESNWKESGIDLLTGNRHDLNFEAEPAGDGVYHPVPWQPLIDGVFIPAGEKTKLDSAGHAYDFPKTDNMMSKCIFPVHRTPDPESLFTNSASGLPYMQSGRGLLCIHANAGITFDLDVIRGKNAGWTPAKFTTTAGNLFDLTLPDPPEGYNEKAEVWVFVDGNLRFHKSDLSHADGPISMEVPLTSTDRFITLVTTDRTANHRYLQTVFGDPVLHLEAGP
jgi:hypothetical protein